MNAAAQKTALTSLLSSYDDMDRTTLEEKDEEDIEKQCKFVFCCSRL